MKITDLHHDPSVFHWWSQRASRVTVRATFLPLHNLKIIQKTEKRSTSNLELNQIEKQNSQRDIETETLRKFYGRHIRKVLGKYIFHKNSSNININDRKESCFSLYY